MLTLDVVGRRFGGPETFGGSAEALATVEAIIGIARHGGVEGRRNGTNPAANRYNSPSPYAMTSRARQDRLGL
jgi:hypothetical protein